MNDQPVEILFNAVVSPERGWRRFAPGPLRFFFCFAFVPLLVVAGAMLETKLSRAGRDCTVCTWGGSYVRSREGRCSIAAGWADQRDARGHVCLCTPRLTDIEKRFSRGVYVVLQRAGAAHRSGRPPVRCAPMVQNSGQSREAARLLAWRLASDRVAGLLLIGIVGGADGAFEARLLCVVVEAEVVEFFARARPLTMGNRRQDMHRAAGRMGLDPGGIGLRARQAPSGRPIFEADRAHLLGEFFEFVEGWARAAGR